jgi:hypothetical protein
MIAQKPALNRRNALLLVLGWVDKGWNPVGDSELYRCFGLGRVFLYNGDGDVDTCVRRSKTI